MVLPANLSDDARYRLLVEAVTDYAIYMLDQDGNVTSWNPGARRFKGYEATEIIGQHFSRFYTDVDRQSGLPARALETARREGRYEGEGWRVRKDGTEFWVNVVIDPIHGSDGSIIGYAKVTRDLTDRKLAEDALRRSEEQFRLLVQGVSDYAIYMLDPEGKVSNWNLGAERIKHYRPEDIIGKHFSLFYTEEDRATGEPAKGLATALREGRFEKEGWRVRKDGTRFFANVVIDPIRHPSGELIGFAKITRDITERKEAEKVLERAREAMVQAQKMESIGQLTGGVAHDFNNLLMAVLGSLELLRRRLPDDPKMRQLLNNAFDGARRGAALTQRMLAFARRQDLTLVSVDVANLVHGMSDLMERSLGPEIILDIAVPSALRKVKVDANQLETALLNLVVNARDAMPRGIIRISATEQNVTRDSAIALTPGLYVRLSVADAGQGMDDDTLKRAMEPFFTTKGVGKGTGLGLSMVHGMAEQLGGRLSITSELHNGTTVDLWLPTTDTAAALASEVHGGAAIVANPTRSMVVLVVDDDRLVLVNTIAMLEELGHVTLEAASGQQALEVIRKTPRVDLVITDQAMPQMTGAALADAIKIERPSLPVLLVSGYAELPAGAGADLPKLSKPFSLEDLEEIVEAFAKGRPPKPGAFTSSYRG